MATINDGWQSIVNLSASDGSIRPVILDWGNVANEAAAATLRAEWETAYAAVGAGAKKSWSEVHSYHDDAFTLPTDPGAERGEYAIIVTSILGDATKTAVINLPFPKDDAGVVYQAASGPSRNIVDTTSADLAAYVAMFGTGKGFISDGEHSAGNIIRGKRSGS